MLTIRSEQRQAMRDSRTRERVLSEVTRSFPEDCAVLGAEQVGRVVTLGLERAAAHGCALGDEAVKFVKLMCVLGSYFDEDPLYPWAAHILADDTLPSPFIRLHNLYRTAAGFLEQTAGANGEHYRRALVRVRSMPYEELVRGRSDDEGAGIQALLYEVYPEHYRTLAQDTFQALESLARSKVQAHGLESREGLLTYILLMFMVGSHFDRDPLHPWVSPVLALQADPRSKSLQLYAAAMDRLDVYKIVDR